MKNILLFLAFCLLLSSFVSATTYYAPTGFGKIGCDGATISQYMYGMHFVPNITQTLKEVEIFVNASAQRINLYYGKNLSFITSSTLSGSNATFNQVMYANISYYIMVNSSAVWTMCYDNAGVTYPVYTPAGKWNSSVYREASWSEVTTSIITIITIKTEDTAPPPPSPGSNQSTITFLYPPTPNYSQAINNQTPTIKWTQNNTGAFKYILYNDTGIVYNSGNYADYPWQSLYNITFNVGSSYGSLNDGNYNLTWYASPGGDNFTFGWTASTLFTVDTIRPSITLNPSNSFDTNNVTANIYANLTLNITIGDARDLYLFSVNVTRNGISYFNFTSANLSGLSTYTFNTTRDVTTWAVGYFNVTIEASDTHTANMIDDYIVTPKEKFLFFEKAGLDFRTAEGNEITIETSGDAIASATKQTDRYNFEFNYVDEKITARTYDVYCDNKLEYMPNSGYKAHFVCWNPQLKKGNWIDFEGIEGKPTIERINDNHYTVSFDSVDKLVVFQSIGGLNVNTVNYQWLRSNLSISNAYILPIQPINESDLYSYVTVTEGLNNSIIYDYYWFQNSSFMFNNTYSGYQMQNILYSTLLNNYTRSGYNYTVSIRAYSEGQYSNFINASVIINDINILLCEDGNKFLNFSHYEENNRTLMYLDVYGYVNYTYDYNIYHDFIFNVSQQNNFTICINYPYNLSVNLYLQHVGYGEIIERYYIINTTYVPNLSSTIFLYNFVEPTTTLGIFRAEVVDEQYLPLEGYIAKLQRYYPSINSYITVQMDKTDEFGKAIFYVYKNMVDYKIVFEKDNIVYDITAPLKINCAAGDTCDQSFIINPIEISDRYANMVYTTSYNNVTKIYTVTWSDTSNLVSSVRLVATLLSAGPSINICDTTTASSSGTILCNVSGYSGDIAINLYRTASPSNAFFSSIIRTATDYLYQLTSSDFDINKTGALFSIFFMIAISTAGLFSVAGVIVSGIVGLIFIFLLKLVSIFTLGFLIAGVCLGVLVAYMTKR